MGINLFNVQKYEAALIEFDDCIRLTSNVGTFYHMRAKCLLQVNKISEAIGDLIISN